MEIGFILLRAQKNYINKKGVMTIALRIALKGVNIESRMRSGEGTSNIGGKYVKRVL